jgi:recombination protein RecT
MSNDRNQVTAIVKDSKEAYAQLQDYLMSRQRVIANIAPKYLDSERMVRLALGASSRNPRLLQCSPKSWLMALMDSAYYGLEPNPILGHAYLVPYQNKKLPGQPYEVQFMIGYKGLILLACEQAGFEDVEARMVYVGEIEGGRFEETPEDPHKPFRHRPLYQPESRGDIAGVYAIGWRGPDKRPRFKYLTIDEVEGYRGRSKAAKEGPWTTDYEAMAQKTAVRRMLAMAQLKPGSKLGTMLEQESAADRDEVIRAQDWRVDDGASPGAGTRTDDLAASLARKAGKEPMPAPRGRSDEEAAARHFDRDDERGDFDPS